MCFRIILFSLICSFSFNAVAFDTKNAQPETTTEYSREVLELVLTVIKNCYKGPKQTTGNQLVQCVSTVFKKDIPNPQFYKVNLTGDCPGDIDLIMFNKRGDVINCFLTFAQSVNVNRCISYKVPPLTNGQELSITSPEVLVK